MNYDIIIVGAGASGLTAAIAAARQGSSVLVIDQKDKAGRKILATGNGKCNFTNTVQQPECYRSDDSAFAEKVLSCFNIQKTIHFFEELGIYPKNRSGYLYPNSEQAASVVQVLLMECERYQVKFQFNEAVKGIKKPYYTVVTEVIQNNSDKMKSEKAVKANKIANQNSVLNQEKIYHCKKLILAAGGCAAPQLGSDGSGFTLAKSLGHTIIKPLPALVQLKSKEKFCKTIAGVRTAAKATLYAGQRRLTEEEGEVLFTDYGISGIPILQLSRFAAKAIDRGETVLLRLDFLPELSREAVFSLLKQRALQGEKKNLEEMLVGFLHHKLNYILIKESGLDIMKKANQLDEQELNRLMLQIKEFKMGISETNSFEQAQVSAGGVSTREIKAPSMESVFSKGLYLTGELVDVDGTCGGYNLQWAWSSGYLAGEAAAQSIIMK